MSYLRAYSDTLCVDLGTAVYQFSHNVFVNYNFHFVVSETSKVGGVGIFVKNTFVVHELEHLQIPSTADSMIENLWLEIIGGNRKYIVGGIYRHPKFRIKKLMNLTIYWITDVFQ